MASLNKVFLIGNLTRDPELRYVPSGAPVVTFGVAVNRPFLTQQGEKKEDVCFVRIVVFGKQAESCSQYLTKGRLVFIEGRLQYRSWEQNGQKRNALDVVADRVQFLGAPKQQAVSEEPSVQKEGFESQEPEVVQEEEKSGDEAPF